MNITAYAKGAYTSMAFKYWDPSTAAMVDLLLGFTAIALGIGLLMTYRPTGRR